MHTDFQIDHYIINKGNWTPYGRLQQARREIDRRERADIELHDQLQLVHIEIGELEEHLHAMKSYARQRADLKLTQLNRGAEQLRQVISNNQAELYRFRLNQKQCLKELGVEKWEDITPEQHRQWEEETWVIKIRALVAMNFASEGRVQQSTWRIILSLPPKLKSPIVEEIFDVMKKLHSPGDIPDIPLLRWYSDLPALEGPDA